MNDAQWRGSTAASLGVFLQARLGSTRLPKKVLLPLSGVPVIEHAMHALRPINADVHVLLTDAVSYEALQPSAHDCGFTIFQGPENDVLARFALAARHYGVDRIIRATGDNPLVSRSLAEELLIVHRREHADFSGFVGAPLGTGVEVLETEALFAADREAADAYEREHVSPFLYRRPERFRIHRPDAPPRARLPEASVTLDTLDDYRFLYAAFEELFDFGPIEIDEIVTWLKRRERSEVLHEYAGKRALSSVH